METIKNLHGKRLDLRTKKGKRTFLIINFLLFFGVVLIVSTLLYLLFNLNQSDRVIYKSILIIILGLDLVMFYAIGYNEINKKKNTHNHYF
jgi:O-antigen/teichoic acid export membrane protein